MSLPKLSVIIPTLNAEAVLPSCLDALQPGLLFGFLKEVIVVDGGSSDQTLLIANAAGCRTITAKKGRGSQLCAGAHNAKGDWFLFLHADTQLEEAWPEAVVSLFQSQNKAAAFTLAYDSDKPEARWLEKRAALRNRFLALPYGDQGLIIHRSLYNEIGGYNDIPLMEDVDIVRRIGRDRLTILKERAITSGDKYLRDGWRKRAWRNAFLLLRYYLGAKPEDLAKSYD